MTVREKAELIVKDIKKEQETNPVVIFKHIAKKEYVSIHGPEHHILDGASLLVAYINRVFLSLKIVYIVFLLIARIDAISSIVNLRPF